MAKKQEVVCPPLDKAEAREVGPLLAHLLEICGEPGVTRARRQALAVETALQSPLVVQARRWICLKDNYGIIPAKEQTPRVSVTLADGREYCFDL